MTASLLFWNNKGGVGKTFASHGFVLAHARAHPDELVVAVDLDPQADLSALLLGDARVAQLCDADLNADLSMGEDAVPPTVAGWLSHVRQAHRVPPSHFLHPHAEVANLRVVCGDPALAGLASALTPLLLSAAPAGRAVTHFALWSRRLRCLFQHVSALAAGMGFAGTTRFVLDAGAYAGPEAALAMLSADAMLVPTSAEPLSVRATARAVRYFRHVHSRDCPRGTDNVWVDRAAEAGTGAQPPPVYLLERGNGQAVLTECAGPTGVDVWHGPVTEGTVPAKEIAAAVGWQEPPVGQSAAKRPRTTE